MLITVAPASTRTGAAVVRALLATDSVQVNALYRDIGKVPEEFSSHHNFNSVKANVSDASTLDFSGSDAVLAITPPLYTGADIVAHANLVSRNVRTAAEKAGIQRLVLLSSVGAQYSKGIGEIKTNHIAENVFAGTNVPEVVFVRCAYFMENWTAVLDTLKAPEPFFFSTITPLDWKIHMVSVEDIGRALARELTKQTPALSKPHIFELCGPQRYTPLDVQRALSEVLEKEVSIKPIQTEGLAEFYGQIFPSEVVPEWVEMTMSFLPGGVMAADVYESENGMVEYGKTELIDSIRAAVAKM